MNINLEAKAPINMEALGNFGEDNRSSYVLFDPDTKLVQFRRLSYPTMKLLVKSIVLTNYIILW